VASDEKLAAVPFAQGAAMAANVGTLDQYIRIVLGLALIAYAFQDGLATRVGTGLGWSAWCRS